MTYPPRVNIEYEYHYGDFVRKSVFSAPPIPSNKFETESQTYSSANFSVYLECIEDVLKGCIDPQIYFKYKKITLLGVRCCMSLASNDDSFVQGDPSKDFPAGLRALNGKTFYANKLDEVKKYFKWIERYCDPDSGRDFKDSEEFERFVTFAEPKSAAGASVKDIYRDWFSLGNPKSLMKREISGRFSTCREKTGEQRRLERIRKGVDNTELDKEGLKAREDERKVNVESLETITCVRKRGNTEGRESDNKILRL